MTLKGWRFRVGFAVLLLLAAVLTVGGPGKWQACGWLLFVQVLLLLVWRHAEWWLACCAILTQGIGVALAYYGAIDVGVPLTCLIGVAVWIFYSVPFLVDRFVVTRMPHSVALGLLTYPTELVMIDFFFNHISPVSTWNVRTSHGSIGRPAHS